MTSPPDRLTAALSDRYRLERELGAGGMATVYLAEDLKHHRQLAIKVLRPELAALLGAERFLKEIETTANLQHPHILPLFDSGQAESFLYYVMPFVAGESLRERLARDGELPVAEAVRIARAVAGALGAAHRRGIVHRDIKPENILLADGEPVVADFGIARAISASAGDRLTSTGLAVGTPAYMSPEQASADSRIDGRTDLYSLGAVLYEMLAGEQPFRGRTAEAITARKMTEDAPLLHSVRPAVPEALDLVVRKALSRTAGDRFQTAEEFIGALEQVTLTESGSTRRVPVTSRRALWLERAPWVIAAGLAGLTLWAWLRPAPPQPVIRQLSGQVAGEEYIPGGGLAISPDGSQLVYRGQPDSAPQLWLRNRGELHATPIPGTAAGDGPVFSPDGRQIAYDGGNGLRVAKLDGSPPVTINNAEWFPGLAWSDDGYIYYGTFAGMNRVRPTGGAPELVFPIDSAAGEAMVSMPEALPGGHAILFTSWRKGDSLSHEIVLGIPSTGERRVVASGLIARYAASGHLLIVNEEGMLFAARFDLRQRTVNGPTEPLLGDVETVPVILAVSHTGTLVYAPSGSGPKVSRGWPVWVERGGRETPVDSNWTVEVVSYGGLALSPDGNILAVTTLAAAGGVKRPDIWLKRLPSGPLSRLTAPPSAPSYQPFWSPDGARLGFTTTGTGTRLGIWQRRSDGNGREDSLLALHGANVWTGSWSPDGHWLIANRIGEGANNDVVAIRPGRDSTPFDVVTSRYNELVPVLSPDGAWLAYSSNESGRREVYVRPFPDTQRGKWQVSLEGGEHPRWSPNGNELYYVAYGLDDLWGASGDMMIARMRTKPTFEVLRREVFAPALAGGDRYYWDYDVHPDGQRLLMVHLVGRGLVEGSRLVVVENFFKELKAKVRQ